MTTKTRATKTQAPAPKPAPVPVSTRKPKYEVNEVRGEYAVQVGDKEALFVPSFRNIAKFEDSYDISCLDVLISFERGTGKPSYIPRLLHAFNDGDYLTEEEWYAFLMSPVGITEMPQIVLAISAGVADPNGLRFRKTEDSEGDSEGNG